MHIIMACRFTSVKLHIFLALFVYVVYIADVAPWATRRKEGENREKDRDIIIISATEISSLLSYLNNNLLST